MKRNHSRPQNVISVGFLKTFSVKSWWGLLISPNGWLPLLFCIVNKRYWDALSPPWYMIHNSEGKYPKCFFVNKSENMFFFFFWRGGVLVVGVGHFFRFTTHTLIKKLQWQKSDAFKWCAQNLKGFKIPTELLRVLEASFRHKFRKGIWRTTFHFQFVRPWYEFPGLKTASFSSLTAS